MDCPAERAAEQPSWESSLHLSRRLFPRVVASLFVTGCGGRRVAEGAELVVYSALDQDFAAPLLREFEKLSGIRVRAVYDIESTKTVGLTQRLLAERARPRCDLFWNNEILNTLRLQAAGLLAPQELEVAERFPAEFRDPAGHWFGFAARARILLVNKERVAAADYPTRLMDLAEPHWQGRFGIAKPLFGTTATHAACLFAAWGPEPAQKFWRAVLRQGHVLSGNKQVAVAVGAGELDCGWTDTDDALAELAQGAPVEIVYPDQPATDQPVRGEAREDRGEDIRGDLPGRDRDAAWGTLFIPNTLSALAGRPAGRAVRELMGYLLSAEVERKLAEGPSGQIPLGKGVLVQVPVATPTSIRAMRVDFGRAAQLWEEVSRWLAAELHQE